MDTSNRKEDKTVAYLSLALQAVVTIGSVYFLHKSINIIKNQFDQKQKGAINAKTNLAKKLKRPEVASFDFSEYELKLLNDVLDSDELNVTFADIGGMEDQLEDVYDNVILPMTLWSKSGHMNSSLSCPSGVLLYGSPGTGKTLTAKALAKETNSTFINIKASSIMEKFVGESDKLVVALFQLGRKLSPTIIFIDEIDTLLRTRSADNNNQVLASVQGLFLTEWDGLQTNAGSQNAPVVILGATNRPMDLDPAFLRRMPVQILTKVPDLNGRIAIFKAQLSKESVDDDVNIIELAEATNNFTGADIKEVIRVAKLQRAKTFLMSFKESQALTKNANNVACDLNDKIGSKPLVRNNFDYALKKCITSVVKATDFSYKLILEDFGKRVQKNNH
eukprot:gene6954-9510_t